MKKITELIEKLRSEVQKQEKISRQWKASGSREDYIFTEGIIDGLEKAIAELEKTNKKIDEQIENLL